MMTEKFKAKSRAIAVQMEKPLIELIEKPVCGLRCVGTGNDFKHCKTGCTLCGSFDGYVSVADDERFTEDQKATRYEMWDTKRGFLRDGGCILSTSDNRDSMSEACLRFSCELGVSE